MDNCYDCKHGRIIFGDTSASGFTNLSDESGKCFVRCDKNANLQKVIVDFFTAHKNKNKSSTAGIDMQCFEPVTQQL